MLFDQLDFRFCRFLPDPEADLWLSTFILYTLDVQSEPEQAVIGTHWMFRAAF
jgi:hypothetical protein